MVEWGKVWAMELFQTSKDGLTSKKGLHPSQGHMATMGAKNCPFPYAGREMPFLAKIGIARMMIFFQYVRKTFVPIPVA